MRLEGEVAVITGSGSGIGREVAFRLAKEGAKVYVVDINEAGALETSELIRQSGGQACGTRCDVTNERDVQQMVARCMQEFDMVSILVNNAGITRDAIVPKMTDDMWDAVFSVNFTGVVHCTRHVLNPMRQRRHGKIVNLSSRSYLGNYGQANYASSKAAIVGLTRSLALECGPYGITVNAVAPGYIDSPMTRGTIGDRVEHIKAASALKMIGQPHDVAAAISFLVSPDARYITGQTINICGGRSIGQQAF